MDKYEDKAQTFCTEMDDHDYPKEKCAKCREVAAALREAAADAYEDAANSNDRDARCDANWLRAKAASLRNPGGEG